MTVETMTVSMAPSSALDVFAAHDNRGESWQLQCTHRTIESQVFELWVDGCGMPTSITLNADGTWKAFTDVLIGEKE